MAQIQPRHRFRRRAQQPVIPFLLCLATGTPAAILLLELVAIHRIVKEIGEVGKQPQIVIQAVEHDPRIIVFPGRAQRIAAALAAIGRIDIAEARNGAAGNRAAGHLVGGAPDIVIGLRRHRPRPGGVTQRRRDFARVIAPVPGPVIVFQLQRRDQVAAAKRKIVGQHAAHIADLARVDTRDT